MRFFGIAAAIVSCLMVSGCFLRMERAAPLPKYGAPYGAHFVKPGMTREERLLDATSCGTRNNLDVIFTREEREKAEKSIEEFEAGKNNAGDYILLRRIHRCMESKGYSFIPIGECRGDKEYQELCVYP
jgi:hypothetical protein